MPKRKKWGLEQVEVEFNVIIAKLRMIFKKKGIPSNSNPKQRAKVRKVVQQELGRMATKKKETPNVIAETIAQIASRERVKAIRKGRYEDAIGAGIIEYIANEYKKSSSEPSQAI